MQEINVKIQLKDELSKIDLQKLQGSLKRMITFHIEQEYNHFSKIDISLEKTK